MRTEALAFLCAGALLVTLVLFGGPSTQRSDAWIDGVDVGLDGLPGAGGAGGDGGAADPMRFGLDAAAVTQAAAHGVRPDYGTLWVGPWTLQWGWADVERGLQGLVAANVTPAVHLYYWGDDIHADCFTVGCSGKTMQGWDELATGLAQRLERLPGPSVVILETEFNKHQVKDNEDLDGYLEQKALAIKAIDPGSAVVLGLGNWNSQAWPTWDRAAAASDYVGMQGLAASTKDPPERALTMAQDLVNGANRARELFGKPVFVHDVAVSSYPEPDHLGTQGEAIASLAQGLDDLSDAGVEAVVYRSFYDVPSMPTSEHYGEAEKHWGLAWRDTGQLKPAGEAWVAAMKAGRVA
jgi:hypothetical protein